MQKFDNKQFLKDKHKVKYLAKEFDAQKQLQKAREARIRAEYGVTTYKQWGDDTQTKSTQK